MNQHEYTPEEVKQLSRELQSETSFETHFVAFARLHGWHCAHFRAVRVQRADGSFYFETPVAADGKGFPDWVLVRERVIFAELKKVSGRFSFQQREWASWLVIAKAEVYGWSPNNWEEIERVLR
jgi:hypothetical protein